MTLPRDSAKVAHFYSMRCPKFCSMNVTQEVHEFVTGKGIAEQEGNAIGMHAKVHEFNRRAESSPPPHSPRYDGALKAGTAR